MKLMDLVSFLLGIVFRAADVERSGWPDRGVKTRLESPLEHGVGLGLSGWHENITQRRGLDGFKVLLMGIVHDIHEGYTGDQGPGQYFPMGETRREKKRFWETIGERIDWLRWEPLSRSSNRKALWRLTRQMDSSTGGEIRRLWKEYHDGKTPEAKFLRELHPLVDAARGVAFQGKPENKRMHSIQSFFDEASVVTKDPGLLPSLFRLNELRRPESNGRDH